MAGRFGGFDVLTSHQISPIFLNFTQVFVKFTQFWQNFAKMTKNFKIFTKNACQILKRVYNAPHQPHSN
ncbi:hypothetical protein B0181_08130 [Moraxella caviae]|uniref:Uncharacterized protein n=1 Tax=Moraxella caviae TaxID=34060 RepID=A0A1S9ZYD5_9GAMM|nr:hypothetical protein B0181_08130 [Moraxella caviae]